MNLALAMLEKLIDPPSPARDSQRARPAVRQLNQGSFVCRDIAVLLLS